MIIAGFELWQVAVALAATLASAFVRGLTGFGFAILLVPVLALALQPIEAVLVTNLMALMIGAFEVRWMAAHAEKSAYRLAGIVLLTTLPGMALLAITPTPLARLLISLVAVSAFVAVLLPPRGAAIPGKLNTLLTGTASGILTGFAGMPGPPVVPFYVGRSIPRQVAKASMVLVFTMASAAGITSGFVLGEMHWRLPVLALGLLPVVFIGNAIGHRAHGRISDRAWRSFAAVVLGAASIAALLKLL